MTPHYHLAACHAADVVRFAAAADARLGLDQSCVQAKATYAVNALKQTAEALGYVAVPVAFIAAIRDCPAMLDPLAALQSFQAEAAQLLPVGV